MNEQIQSSIQALRDYIERRVRADANLIDRPEVVAHATLSGFTHHWPAQATSEILGLLAVTPEIKATERSRWAVQRRIAIAKLARELSPFLIMVE